MRVVGYVAVGLLVGAAVGAVAIVASSTGDIKRYIRMRSM